jgi:hypothetical protein
MQWSLEDVYKKRVRGNIPPREHLHVLDEAKVTIEFDDGNIKEVEIDQDEARKLLRLGKQNTSIGVINDWVESGGWDSPSAIYNLSVRINDIYAKSIQLDNVGIREEFYDEVERLTRLKNSNRLSDLQQALNKGTANFLRVIEKLGAKYDLKHVTNRKAVELMSQITFEEGAVGVGPGEAVLTLFSEGKNPKEGDITLPDGSLVEVKSGAGRPGKGKTLGLIRNFNKFAKLQLKEANIDENIIQTVFSAIKDYEFNVAPAQQRVVDRVISVIDNSSYDLETKLKLVEKDVRRRDYFENIKDSKGIDVTKYLADQREELKMRDAGEAIITNSFFAKAPREKLVAGLSEFSSEPDSAVSIIDSFLDAAGDPELKGRKIAAGFQIAEYFKEEEEKGQGFNYFLFFNKDNFNMVTIGPFKGKGYREYATSSIQKLFELGDSITISPNTGGGRGGYNLTIK